MLTGTDNALKTRMAHQVSAPHLLIQLKSFYFPCVYRCPGASARETLFPFPPWCLSCWELSNHPHPSDFLLGGHWQWSDLNTGCIAEVFKVLFINLCGNLAQALLQLFSFRISRSTGTTTLWEPACYFDFNPIITNLTNWFNGNGFPEKAELASWGFMHILVIYAEGKLRGNMENVNTENLGGKN